jgi:hypothetical protein
MNLKHVASAVALAIAGTASSQAIAQMTLEQRVEQLERENARQAAQISEQKQALEGSFGRVKKLAEAMDEQAGAGAGWFEGIEIGGLIEVEAGYVEPYDSPSESDIVLATFELGIASQVTNWVEVGASLLYEQDDTDLEVDVAFITLFNPDVAPVFFTAGQFYVPFGAYETNLIDDPLTLEIGESRETAAQLGFVYEGFGGSVYGFNGDNQVKGKSRIDSWGANLTYAWENDDWGIGVGAGYINDLGDSDSLQDTVSDNRNAAFEELVEGEDTRADTFSTDPLDRVGGWTANLLVTYRGFDLIGEYLSATGRFNPDSLAYKDKGAAPSAWNLEVGYTFVIRGYENVVAAAYQGTDQAVGLELPKESYLVGWSIGIFDNTSFSLQYRHDQDYKAKDGGTGKRANSILAQLAFAF